MDDLDTYIIHNEGKHQKCLCDHNSKMCHKYVICEDKTKQDTTS